MDITTAQNIKWLQLNAQTNTTLNASKIKADLNILQQKAQAISKNLTQWDLYKIKNTVHSAEEYDSVVNNLLPNTGAIINCDTFTLDQDIYSRGDIVFKFDDFTVEHIKAERGGIFAPTRLTRSASNTNTFDLEYSFVDIAPVAGSTEDITNNDTTTWQSTANAAIKTFKDINIVTNSPLYTLFWKRKSPDQNYVDFSVQKIDNQIVRPVIKFFTTDNEEVYCEYSMIISSGDKWRIQGFPTMVEYIAVK